MPEIADPPSPSCFSPVS